MAALAHYWFFRELPLKVVLPLAAVMTGLGIFGDLTESALKRGAGDERRGKDSSWSWWHTRSAR